MDHFISLGCMSSKFGSLNRCRLYMKVIHLSNITLADGKLILPDSKLGNRESLRQSKLDWPTQEKPPPAAWQLWCNALGHFEHNNRLLVPLGDWIHPSHQLWDWFKDAAELFHQKGIEHKAGHYMYNAHGESCWRKNNYNASQYRSREVSKGEMGSCTR
jgi:hypothetical protein